MYSTRQSDASAGTDERDRPLTGRDVVFEADIAQGCSNGGPGAPAYLFWQVGSDASRITICRWYLDQAVKTDLGGVPSDTGRIPDYMKSLYQYYGSNLWTASGKDLPDIEKFYLFDGVLITAVSQCLLDS